MAESLGRSDGATTLQWARFYASRGWSPVPCRPGTKFPANEWLRYQTALPTDNQLVDWFGAQGFTRLGIVTGQHSGIVVADFDGEDGLASLNKLEAMGFPMSVRQMTPRGGCHVILRHPGGHVPTRKAAESPWRDFWPGMDIRGDGGFIMAAPSTGEKFGAYAWDVDAHPEEHHPAAFDAPEFWRIICEPTAGMGGVSNSAPPTRGAGSLGIDIGQVVDGRETYMRNTVLAVARGLYDRLGRLPTAQEVFDEGWPQYSARVDLSRPGRGESEFRAKVAYTLHRLERGSIPSFTNPAANLNAAGQDTVAGAAEEKHVSPLWLDTCDPTTIAIPRRPWCVPGYLMRGSVSVLSGQGAGGKSSLVVALSIACARGEAMGAFVPAAPLVVVNYNTEDDQDEQRRRYSAALTAQQVPGAAIANRVIRCGPHNVGTLFERHHETGRITATAAMNTLRELVESSGADVLICDPLAELHNAEENDNTAMRAVVAAFRAMAQELGIAVMILHHDRKGNNAPGDMDRVRGASAISGAVRVMLTLTTMSQEEAEKFGIPLDQRRRHFRVDGAKSNYAPAQDAEWWRLDGYEIPNGETVAAALPWQPPSAFEGVSLTTCVAILGALRRGLDGHAYGAKGQAKGSALEMMQAQPFGLEAGKASAILAAWKREGVIREEQTDSPNSRHKRLGIVVDDAKFHEMRQSDGAA